MIPSPSPAEQRALIACLAPARLRRFRAVFDGRDRDAVELYRLDALIASHLHASIRALEIALREAMHRALASHFGPRWFDEIVPLVDSRTRTLLAEAARKVGTHAPSGAVVAQLMIGSWVALLDQGGSIGPGLGPADHEAALWETALQGAFARGGGDPSRADIHALAQCVNWARNRINHCEPVVFGFPQPGQSGTSDRKERRSPAQLLGDLRALCGHFDPELATWISGWDVDDLLDTPKAQLALDHIAAQPRVSLVR